MCYFSDDSVQALPTMALIDRFKGLNKRYVLANNKYKTFYIYKHKRIKRH